MTAKTSKGLANIRAGTEVATSELVALLEARRCGPFVSLDEGRRQTHAMIGAKFAADAPTDVRDETP